MIDSRAHIETQDYDEYSQREFRGSRRKRRNLRRRRPPIRYGNLGFPIKVKFPTKKQPKIVKGTPHKAIKFSPINPMVIKNTGVISPNVPSPFPKPRQIRVKRSNKAIKTKVGIDELMAKTNSKTPIKNKTAFTNTKARQATKSEAMQSDAKKKSGASSDSKVGKIVKVIAGIGVVGITGYIIYRVVKLEKLKKTQLKK